MFQIAEKIVPAPSIISYQNDPGDRYFIILSGKVQVLRNDSIFEHEYEHQSKAPKFSWLDCLLIVVLSILCGIIYNFSASDGIDLVPEFWDDEMVPNVAPEIALTTHWDNSVFVDARPNIFYKQEHIKGAINVPVAIFDIIYMIELRKLDKNRYIIVYGRTVSSLYDKRVARKFVLRGHRNTMILKGGLPAWKKKGYPVKS